MSSPDITTPLVLHVDVPATADAPGFKAKAMLDRDRGQYYATAVTVEHMSVRITSARVSATPVQKTMAPVLRGLLASANPALVLQHPLVKKWATGKPQRPVKKTLIENPDQTCLEGAALVYRLAKLSGEAPIKAAARAAGIEHEQAKHWLRLARANDLV